MEPFDFAAPATLPPGVAELIVDMLSGATQRAALLLSSMLRLPVQIQLGAPTPWPAQPDDASTRFALDHGEPSAAPGLAAARTGFVLELADVIMGGPGLTSERTPSPLEVQLAARRISAGLVPLADALHDVGVRSLSLAPIADEQPAPTDAVGIPLDIQIGEVAGTIALALPLTLFSAAIAQTPMDDALAISPAIAAALVDVPVSVAVQFDPVRVPASDIEELAVGDVIRLDHPYGHPVMGYVDGHPFFLAQPGRRGRSLAVRVEHIFEGSDR